MPSVFHWNPHKSVYIARRRIPIPFLRTRNFGDLIGPWLVRRLVSRNGLGKEIDRNQRLLTVGSIVAYASRGDVIWGSGLICDPVDVGDKPPSGLDVRAVRGPATARLLRTAGNSVPDVYGDPALLVPHLWEDEELGIVRRSGGTVTLPHFKSDADWPQPHLSARGSHLAKIRAIGSAELVISSSLHGIILAEAYGVPVIPVKAPGEPEFKYRDYFEGTGRSMPGLAPTLSAALRAQPLEPLTSWDPQPLLRAFPDDLWAPAS